MRLAVLDTNILVLALMRPSYPPPGLPDPTDWSFMACALAAGCSVITGNLKHFATDGAVWVMAAREWVDSAGNS